MRVIFFSILCLVTLQSCKSKYLHTVQSANDSIVLKDSVRIRALVVTKNALWYAGSESKIGYINFKTGEQKQGKLPAEQPVDFRSLATNGTTLFYMSIGNPAQLFSSTKELEHIQKVYYEKHESVFYDAIAFFNTKQGIAIGDPTQKALAILLTKDGGKNWLRIPESDAPQLEEGEAAFAASNTNIVIQKNLVWIITGGKKSHVWHSKDFGAHWERFEIPIKQGGEMTGAFTAAFYDANVGVVAGGDYSNQNDHEGNLILTIDGGKTWKRVNYLNGPTYISCIQFVPNSKGKEIVTVGAGGLFYSSDQGQHWLQLDSNSSLYTLRCLDENTLIAAGKNRIIRYELVR